MPRPDAAPPSSPPLLNLHLATPKPTSSSLFPAPSQSPSSSHVSSFDSSSTSGHVPPESKPKASKNSLFDASFAPILPPPPSSAASIGGRSRSSTTESRYSTDESLSSVSTGGGRSSRKSWMDVEFDKGDLPPFSHTSPFSIPPSTSSSTLTPGIPALAPSAPTPEKTPLPLDPSSSNRPEYPWPLTPPSPFPTSSHASSSSVAPPPAMPSGLALPPPLSPPRPPVPHRSSTFKPLPPPSTSPSASSSFPSAAPASPSVQAGKSSNPLLDTRQSPLLRLSPTAPYLLGEGRHASVYLASYLPRDGQVKAERRSAAKGKGKKQWCLCAAKRLLPDRESQVGGLGEAFILAKLAPPAPSASSAAEEAYPAKGAQNVIRLFGVRDERDGVEKPVPLPAVTPLSLSVSASGVGLSRNGSKRWDAGGGEGAKSPLKQSFADGDGEGGEEKGGDHSEEESLVVAARARKTNASTLSRRPRHSEPLGGSAGSRAGGAVGGNGNGHHRLSLLSALEPPLSSSRRRVSSGGLGTGPSSPSPVPSLPSSPPAALRPPTSPSSSTASPTLSIRSKPSTDPSPEPRISLLLSYSPHGHLLQYAPDHPEQVGKTRWLQWARDLAGAVEWCHSRGVLHADLKPQNVMLSPSLTPLLSDFGSSLFLPPPSSPSHLFPTDPHGLGTPTYSPPEFVRPLPSPFSYPADIFSLGVTLGVLLTAREPYEGLRTMERMVWVSKGEWWEWEERRRLTELAEEGEEIDFDEGSSSFFGGAEGDLSRQSSMRSVRSGRSSLRSSLRRRGGRRDDSVESVRSWSSTPDGGWTQTPVKSYGWEEVARSLLIDEAEEEEEGDDGEEGVVRALREAMPSRLLLQDDVSRAPSSPSHSRRASTSSLTSSAASAHSLPPPTLFYPSTSTPLQYFLSFSPFDGSPDPTAEDVVPLAVRELLRRMTRPSEKERPSAREVREELERIATEEGVDLV